MIINMFSFGNYIWKNFKIKMLHLLALTQHQPLQDPPRIIKVNNLKSLH